MKWLLVLLSLGVSTASAQDAPAQPQPIFQELRIDGATVFSREDIVWMLEVREGSPLPKPPAEVARTLQEAYERDGYSEARVTSAFEAGRLSLIVEEGRIDDVEILGVTGDAAERARRQLGIKAGDIYNKRTIGQAVSRFVRDSQGALAVGRPRYSRGRDPQSIPDEVTLERRGPRSILVVPFEQQAAHGNLNAGSGREDLFSPVDGFAPGLAYSTTIFDHAHFNHAFVNAFASYKFGREAAGYSIGGERPIFQGPRLFLGAELHDLTASDDLWRLSSAEQTLVSVAFKNTFRDYYRRRGAQVFTVLRMGTHHELSAMARWDRHEPLANATSYSFFRDDASYRPNMAVIDQRVNALVLGYTFDTRRLSAAGQAPTYQRHLKDNLFGQGVRQQPGVRLEWTSEIAGHGLKGDADFDRHIVQARGYLPIGEWTQLSLRGLLGFSNGSLPVERTFAIGGIGSVHGYRFKEAASGTGLTLVNAEYRVNLTNPGRRREGANVFVFYDAGHVRLPETDPRELTTGLRVPDPGWLRGIGFGAGAGGVRIEFGFRANDIPRSRQILVRFSPTF
jgi:outer membrane protein assembly factor BamA